MMENEVIQAPQGEQVDPPAVAPQAAPQLEQTAAPEGEEKQAPEKTLTQSEVDAIIQKEKAKAEARAERRALKAYRETLERFVPQQQAPVDDVPKAEHFSDTDSYVKAMVQHELKKRDAEAAAQSQYQELMERKTKTERLYAEASKFSGFDADSFNALIDEHGTQAIAHAIAESDKPGELMTWMVQHPDDVARISKLSPIRQAAEIGRLEAKLSTPKPFKEPPAPIKTVSGAGTVSNGDPSKMSMDEYMAMRKKQGASWSK